MAYCYFDTFTSPMVLPAWVKHDGLPITEQVLCFVSLEYYNAISVSMAYLDQKK